jgi:predicted enzyme related to lactoylglutathione lyase
MLVEPNVIVLYVNNLALSSSFYQDLLEMKPEEESITFHSFKLSNGLSLALKAKHSVVPPTDEKNGSGELAFTVENSNKVDELFAQWQAKQINMIFPPTILPFGYTFVAVDPDGYRLRVASLGSKE